jgi:hypothetical protein
VGIKSQGACFEGDHSPKVVDDTFFVRFEVFTAVKIQIEVRCVVKPCSVAVGYQRFGEPYCLHLRGVAKSVLLFSYQTSYGTERIVLLDLTIVWCLKKLRN